jgi:hypothetical protein
MRKKTLLLTCTVFTFLLAICSLMYLHTSNIAYSSFPGPGGSPPTKCKINQDCVKAGLIKDVCISKVCKAPVPDGKQCTPGTGTNPNLQGDCSDNSFCGLITAGCTQHNLKTCGKYICQPDQAQGQTCSGSGRGNCQQDLLCISDKCTPQSQAYTCGQGGYGTCPPGETCVGTPNAGSVSCGKNGGPQCSETYA